MRRTDVLRPKYGGDEEVPIDRADPQRNWRLAGVVVFAVAGFLLLSMGGAVLAAPVTVPLMLVVSRRHPTTTRTLLLPQEAQPAAVPLTLQGGDRCHQPRWPNAR